MVLIQCSDRVVEASAALYRTEMISTFDLEQFQDRLYNPLSDLKRSEKMRHFFVKKQISRP